MKKKEINASDITIQRDANIKVTRMGLITEIQFMSFRNTEPKIRKVSEEEYMVLETGEIKPFEKKAETRNESIASLRKTLKYIRELVTTNVVDPRKVRWVTLTYKENVRDTKKLYDDFRKFHQRFRYYLAKNNIEQPEYISVAEPQLRGAWHLHILYIWKKHTAPFIANSELSKIWGHGFTTIKALDKDKPDIASYLCAYLQDLEIDDELSQLIPDDLQTMKAVPDSKGKEKRIAKGMRMYLYPAKMNIVRHSKNIKYPESFETTYEKALHLVHGQTLKYETAYQLSDETGFSFIVKKQEFKQNPVSY